LYAIRDFQLLFINYKNWDGGFLSGLQFVFDNGLSSAAIQTAEGEADPFTPISLKGQRVKSLDFEIGDEAFIASIRLFDQADQIIAEEEFISLDFYTDYDIERTSRFVIPDGE